ncbi:PA14 domain-containing protein [Laspinema palackyanum]|uniref:PA14 domain-containing protein n=1 Tax=Laspinema palackyanum TaxID=3231601 RepID=UPI00345D9781|nr:PA14 domain-containing protein [Laspinema sp. D2c]
MFKLFFGFHKRPPANGFQPQSKRYQGPAMRLEEMRTPSGIVLDDTETTDDSGAVANSDLGFEDFEFPSQESDMGEELPGEELDPESLDVAEDGNTETNLAEEDLENLPYFYGDIDDEPSSESDGDLVTDIAESTDAEPQESSSDETAEIASDSTDSSNSTDPEFEELDWIEADGASDESMGDESELNPDDEVNTETVEEAIETDGLSEKSMGDESELKPDDEVNTETVEEAVEEKALTLTTEAIKPEVDQPDILAQLSETDTPEDTTNPEIETLTPESDYIITDEIEAEDSSLGAEPDEGGESESYSSFAKLSDSDTAETDEGIEPQVDNNGGDSENEPLDNEEIETHSDDEASESYSSFAKLSDSDAAGTDEGVEPQVDNSGGDSENEPLGNEEGKANSDNEGVEPQANTSVGNSENEPLVNEEGETNSNDEPEDSATSEAEETTAESEAEKSGLVADTKFVNLKPKFESGTFKVGETGQVEVDFIFDGGAYKGQVAIVSLSGMEGLDPNSREFFLEAISRAASNSELGYMVIDDNIEGARFEGRLGEGNYNSGEYQGVKSFLMRPGDEFFLMLVPNGTVQQVLNNPNAGGALRPLFSLATANPHDGYHFGQIADITGDGSAFAWEDIRIDGNSDRDYNDIVLQFRGATGKAALMDDVVAQGKDWRGSDLGQAVIEYVKTYITPEPANLDAAFEDLLADLESLLDEADSFDENFEIGIDTEFDDDSSLADDIAETDVEFESIAALDETEVADDVTEPLVEFEPIAAESETEVTNEVGFEAIAAEGEAEVEEAPVEFEAIATSDETEVVDEVIETPVPEELIAVEGETEVANEVVDDVEEEAITAETEPKIADEVEETDVEEEPITAETEPQVADEVAEIPREFEAIAAEGETEVADEVTEPLVEEELIAAETEPQVAHDIEEAPVEFETIAAESENSSQTLVEAAETQNTPSISEADDTESVSPTSPIETRKISDPDAISTPALSPTHLAKTELTSRLDNLTQTLKIQANNSQTSSVSVNTALIERLETLTQNLQNQNTSRPISESTLALVSRLEEMVWQSSPALPVAAPTFSFAAANQPLVGIIDTGFSGNNPDIDYSRITWGQDHIDGDNDPTLAPGEGNEHGTHILGVIAAHRDNGIGIDGINPQAPIWAGRAVGSGKWAESLVEFVDAAVESGQPNAVVNLSLDLTQIDAEGNVTTRYEFTPMERAAIEYARQHNVMIVVAAGNDGGVMSALGQSSQEFDNIITVGASERFNNEIALSKAYNRTEYSSYGYGLDIVAPGGTIDNPKLSLTGEGVGAMAGTSVATAKVTGAVSQVWAANPSLIYRQVIEIIKNTATDLGTTGFDLETGAGLLNMVAAVQLAKATTGEGHDVLPTLIPETWGGEGVFTAGDRAVNQEFWKDGKYYNWVPYQIKAGDTLSHLALRHLGNAGYDYYMWIAQKNGLANPNYLVPGQWIQVPQLIPPPPPKPPTPEPPQEAQSISFMGTVVFNPFEGGFYGVLRDGFPVGHPMSRYLPLGQDAQNLFKGKEGSRVKLTGIPKNVPTYQMWGQPIEILSADFPNPKTLPPINSLAQKAIDSIYKINKIKLGEPTGKPVDLGNGFLKQNFEKGHITWNGQKAIAYFSGTGLPTTKLPWNQPVLSQIGFDGKTTHPGFIEAFNRNGGFWNVGRPTGYVERWERGHTQRFTGGREKQGAIMKPDGSSKAYWVGGPIWQEFLNRGGAEYIGYPKTDAISVKGGLDNSGGKVQHFRGGNGIPSKIWSSKHGAHPTWGAIGDRYDQMGGPSSWLGFPSNGEKGIGNGWVKQDFEGGYMLWHPQHGTTVYNTKSVDSLPPDSGNGSTHEWTVKYWNNTNLSGTPVWTMTEPSGEIRFNAGSGAPVGTQGVKEDNFSARWETTSHFDGGFYNFISKADDGVRVYVNGVKVIDKWNAGEPWSRRDAYIAIPKGEHKIMVEYFEEAGIAGQTFKWEPSGLLNEWTGAFRPVGYDGQSVHSTYVNTYQRNGAIPKLGYPINNVHVWERGHTQDFEGGSQGRGAIMKSNANDNSYWVGGKVWTEFLELGGARTTGYPSTDLIRVSGGLDKTGGHVQRFRGGPDGIPTNIWLSKHGAHPTWGAIGGKYEQLGGPSSWLGFPTNREQGIGNGWVKQDFEGGYILWHSQHGTIAYDTKAIDTLPPDSGNSSTSNWHAQYWNNKNLTSSPLWSKYEEMSDLRFHAGNGAPVGTQGIKEDEFGARWITTSYFDGGIYNFINQADDGVRVYVDGKLIIDKWKDSPFEERRAFAAIEPGYHQVMVEYHENKGGAANLLRWEQANPPKEWAVEYFRGQDLNPNNLAGHRGGGTGFIDKNWGEGKESGIPIGNDDFSDRWTTTRYFDEPGIYELNSQADDGIRIWVDDQLVIDKWHDQGFVTNKALIALDKGFHRIRVEHYENKWSSAIKLDWKKVAGKANIFKPAWANPNEPHNPLDSRWSQPWVAEYYNNLNLEGAPVATRMVDGGASGSLRGFDLSWGTGSPDPKISTDNFSSRLITHRDLVGGVYKFNLKGDDGVRVYINGEKVIDRWDNPPFGTPHQQVISLPSGMHRIEVEHSEKTGLAYVGLDWDYLSAGSIHKIAPELTAIHTQLEQQLGKGAVGVPVHNLQQQYYSPPIPPGFYGPTQMLPAFYQEFRGTQGRGAIFAGTGHYVFGKLWESYQNGGGVEHFGPPVAPQKHLGNGAYELELRNGRLFWAPGMTNPTYYEYAQGTQKTLTIPADAWRGEYFDNRNWAGNPLVVRQDSASRGHLDKYWNFSQSPAPGMPKDNFSVRWTTNRPFDRGTYLFKAAHDDGFMVSVNAQKPIDKMMEVATQTTGYATFTKGGQYPVEVKHREYGGAARANLEMQKASSYVVGLDPANNASPTLVDAFNKHGGYDRVGLPINDVHLWHHGYVQDFNHGKNGRGILMRRHNTTTFYYVHGKIWDTYFKEGGPAKLGYPTSDSFNDGHGNTAQEFENHRITRRPNGETFLGGYVNGHLLPGDFYRVWKKYNMGTPTSGVQTHSSGAKFQIFDKPGLGTSSIVSSSHGTFPLYGGIRSYYVNTTGGLNGPLGAPKSAEYHWNGHTRQDFAGGYILWKAGQSAIGYRPDGSLLYPPPSSGGGGNINNGGPITNLQQYIHRLYGGSPGYRSQDYHPDHLALDTVHQGAAPHKVYSLTGGEVKLIRTDQNGGKYVTVWNEELQRTFLYLHFNDINPNLREGQKISAGHYLGNEGWTGYTIPSGPGGRHTHVHVTRPNGTREHPITALSRLSSGNPGSGNPGSGNPGGTNQTISGTLFRPPLKSAPFGMKQNLLTIGPEYLGVTRTISTAGGVYILNLKDLTLKADATFQDAGDVQIGVENFYFDNELKQRGKLLEGVYASIEPEISRWGGFVMEVENGKIWLTAKIRDIQVKMSPDGSFKLLFESGFPFKRKSLQIGGTHSYEINGNWSFVPWISAPKPVPIYKENPAPQKIAEFLKWVIDSGQDVEQAVDDFLKKHPDVLVYIGAAAIAVGVGMIIYTLGEDIMTFGVGLWNSLPMISAAIKLIARGLALI